MAPGKRGHIVADTLLPTQTFPRLPARATFVADTNLESGTQKMFLILFKNILCPQQMFPSLRSPRNIMGNNVSPTMCPRLQGPYEPLTREWKIINDLFRLNSPSQRFFVAFIKLLRKLAR